MANDIVNINVAETVETVAITVNPNLTTVNINRQVPVGVNGQDLQSVTDIGSVTTNSITANSFIKSGGTASQILAANGSVITAGTNITISGGTISSTGGGGATNLTTSQTASNFTINSDTGTDASVPLGNGTLAGATLNDYTTAEKTKLSGIATGAEVNVNADWNATSGDAQILNKPALEQILINGNQAENVISLTYSGLGSMSYGGYSTSYTDTTDRNITLFYVEGISAGGLSFALPSNKLDGGYILATVDDIIDGVPYTGATSDVDLGEFGIQLGNLEFDNTPTNIPTTAGSMYYNDSDGTLDLILKGGNVKLQIGQESVVRVVNKTSTNISLLEANYQAVRVTGAQGQRLKVDLAQATTDQLSAETIGLVTETIANNQEGFITTSGLVRNINTTGSLQGETWADGDVLYLSPTVAGRITKVKPIAPNHLVIIGYVIHAHATQGTIFVKVDNGYELDELHNVKIDTATNNEVLAYTSATDIWENKTPSEAGLQPTLVSATNIKTINGNSILGSGDLVISGTGISSLNGLTGATQTFSTTSNTSTLIPAWTSSGTNHQLNIPIAGGATTTGLITGTSQIISGSKQFTSNPEIPVPAGNSGTCIVLGTTGGGGATGTLQIGSTTLYPTAQEMQYVKGITSSVQTQLNGKASGLDVAEQTYSLSPAFTGTAPTTISSSTYQWNQLGTLVTGRVNLIYTTAGSISQVVIPLPVDMPTPLSPTGLSGALDILYYGVGMFNTTTTTVSALTRSCLLRRNAANTGYEFVITHTTAVSSRVISLTLQYFT